jgi:hypothetical protein
VIEYRHGLSQHPPVVVSQPGASAGSITAKNIAWCARTTVPWRHNWAKENRLKPHPPFSEYDAVETALAMLIATPPRTKRGPRVWDALRAPLRELWMAGADIWIVIAQDGPTYAAVDGEGAAGIAAAEVEAPVWVLHAADAISSARQRFAELPTNSAGTGQVTPIKTASSSEP